MEVNSGKYVLKQVNKLLDEFLRPKCQVKKFDHLDKLLTHLAAKSTREVYSTLIDLPDITEWLMKTVPVWTLTDVKPTKEIGYFTLSVASLVTENELRFCNLNNNNFYAKLVRLLQARDAEASVRMKLAYIKLLSSFLEHKSGVEWMVASNFWEDILKLATTSRNVFVVNESRKFFCKILSKVVDFDEVFCDDVVKKILLPLKENGFKMITFYLELEIDDETAAENIRPTLQLIGCILDHFLEHCDVDCAVEKQDLRVVGIFLKHFQMEQMLDFSHVIQNKHLAFDLGKILLIMQFLEVYFKINSGQADVQEIRNFIIKVANVFNMSVHRGNFVDVMKFCHFSHCFQDILEQSIPKNLIPETRNFQMFVEGTVFVQMIPLFMVVNDNCSGTAKWDVVLEDEIREDFRRRMLQLAKGNIRMLVRWKEVLKGQNYFRLSIEALIHIMKSRKHYKKDVAVVIFQLMIYVYIDYVSALKEKRADLNVFEQNQHFLSFHLETLAAFIEKFDISWKDCMETIKVMDVTYDLLSVSKWSSNLVVNALKLFNLSLTNLLTPNLALLVDKTNDSTVSLLGDMLSDKCKDNGPKIRNMSVEVASTMSNLAHKQFPSLQKVLMDSDLPGLVVKMATQDGESFVRATAIKCLQEMIQVEEIWNNALQSQDLSEKMRQILINETEGIVRVEAATFMCISYENNHFPDDSLEKVYETMIHSSTTDLHWEVKVRALSFWDKVIHNHLQHQGMIDGSFPSVTFSKEHRKIVTLTDAEIKKRLQKILGQLSCIGCLGVLISAIRDDCDMEVSKTAVKITQKLVELLKKYSINADSTVPISPQPTENGMSSSASISSGISGDDFMGSPATNANTELNEEIIDQIVNSRDVNLLQNVYTPSDYGSVLNYDVQVRKIVSPNEFLLFTQQDLNAIINEKKNWLNGIEDLGSLLDDMLKTYDDDVNSMDCY